MEDIKKCCQPHPMYSTLLCDKPHGHEGLHKTIYNYDTLYWGFPTYEEMYDIKRTK